MIYTLEPLANALRLGAKIQAAQAAAGAGAEARKHTDTRLTALALLHIAAQGREGAPVALTD